MSAKFELEAMKIALEELMERVHRIEIEICGECREASADGEGSFKSSLPFVVRPSARFSNVEAAR